MEKKEPKSDVSFLDCMEGMKNFSDKQFKIAVVDTNWGIGESSRDHASRNTPILQKSTGNILNAPQPKYKKQDWDHKQPDHLYFDELFRVSEYQIIMGENYLRFKQKTMSTGRIVWDKVNGGSDFSDCEIFWTNLFPSVKLITYMWNGMFQGKSLAEPRKAQGNKQLNEKRIQSAHKPILLYRGIFTEFVQPEWNILSTHVGSGSDRIAAYDMGFDFTGFENNLSNFKGQEIRFQQYKQQPELYRGY